MNYSQLLKMRLFFYAISICFGTEAFATGKSLVVTIPAPMSEFLKLENQQETSKRNQADSTQQILTANPNCQANEQFLDENLADYKIRLRTIKWKKENHTCDARFNISHIKARETKTPFHHMSVEASLEASTISEWAKVTDSENAYSVTFVPAPFTFETMNTPEQLGQLYARRIWKISTALGQDKIRDIIINKSADNAKIVDAVLTELKSQTRTVNGDSDYRELATKVVEKPVTSSTSLSPAFEKLAKTLTSKQQSEIANDPNASVLIALHQYFSDYQRIDFAKDTQPEKVLKSLNNGIKMVHLLRKLRQIINDHPDYVRALSDSLMRKLTGIFSQNSNSKANDGEVDHLAGLMSTILPTVLSDNLECQNITSMLLNAINGEGQVLTELTIEELLMKSMAALSPVISELAIDSINNLIESGKFSINNQPIVAAKNQMHSAAELNRLFFEGIELSNQNTFDGTFREINVVFARLKEFYLRAYQGILLYDKDSLPSGRKPASEGEVAQVEQVISSINCPIQKYKLSTRVFDASSEIDLEFKRSEPESTIAIPVTQVPVETPLSIDLAKVEVERQLTAAANSLPLIMSTSGGGQLEQLLAVMSQQSLSVVDILRNTKLSGTSSFDIQFVLSPADVFNLKGAATGSKFSIPTEKLLPQDGDPLCDARNVIIVFDYRYKSDGTVNFAIQWGLQLPRQFQQALSEFTKQRQGVIVKNAPGKPDQVHISDFQLMPPKKKGRSHFALFTLRNENKGLKKITANIKFGPQMSLRFDRKPSESRALDFSKIENVFIETPFYADLSDALFGYLKNADSAPWEILWNIGWAKGASLIKGNVCTENETFGPMLNLTKAYPQPLQDSFNKLGLYDVLMHSGKARLDEIGLEIHIDPSKTDSEGYTPSMKLNRFELQVFPYVLEGKYYPEQDHFNLVNPESLGGANIRGQRVMLNLGHWLCFPLPHNKEVQIMNGISETLNTKMPDVWGRARKILNQIKSIMGKPIKNPTHDVDPIDTDTESDLKAGA